ncbi:Hydroxyquinol 1,2-dioxygenase [compost metagenome]
MRGRVLDLAGMPVPHASIEAWQADECGHYDVQTPACDGEHVHRARGHLRTDDDGRFWFRSILAEPYPIPHDGPVGAMLEALGRHPWRPAHLHFMVTAPGCETLITHVFRNGDRYLDSDAVFGVRSTLVADWVPHPPGIAPDGKPIETPYYTLDFDFVLSRAREAQ